MKIYNYDEWWAEGELLFGKNWINWKFVCPMCGHSQTGKEFLERTNRKDEELDGILGFACIGRHLKEQIKKPKSQDDHAMPVKMKGGGCNWTLGGLFQLHEVQIIKDEKKLQVFDFYRGGKP